MKLTDMIAAGHGVTIDPPAPRLNRFGRKIDYTRIFAWLPVWTHDEGWAWLCGVWKISVEGVAKPFFSLAILPF